MIRSQQIYPIGPHFPASARVVSLATLLALAAFLWADPACAQFQFPGPASVNVAGEALSTVSLPLEVDNAEFLVSGLGIGDLVLHRYSPGAGRLLQISQTQIGGQVVALIPWEGRPLLSQGVVAATVNPDRLVFIQVRPQAPHFTLEGSVDLEEDPGTVSFLGELVAGVPELAVSLPGIDKVAFLKQEAETWNLVSVQDTGDDPHSILGIDLDGDQVRELVTANRGPLSQNLGIFRRNPTGQYEGSMQDFAAGSPSCLTGFDLDQDGQLEIAAIVKDSPQVVLLRDVAGQLTPFDSIDLTLPAEGLHLTNLFDGTKGLFTTNQQRGLVDFFQLQQGDWVRRNSYFPGCHPLSITSGDLNGDGGRDLITLGGDAQVVTVLFANPQPGFWGFPALTLNASPGALAVADFDGDGLVDLVVANGDQPLLSFFAGQTGGGFTLTPVDLDLSFYPGQVAAIDTDADPEPELAILNRSGDRVVLADFLSGQGFSIVGEIPTGDFPSFISARDLDDDGFGDLLIITREVDEVLILFGAGNHSFPGQMTMGLNNGADWIETVDLNADGRPDLVFSDGVNRVWTTVNLGGRTFDTFEWLNAGSGVGIMAVGDLDQDLDEDLVAVNRSDESLTLFENTGTGVLTRRIGAHTLSSAPTGVAIRDLDQDGRPEIVMNLRPENMLGVSVALSNWNYGSSLKFSGGPDVVLFEVDDFNQDLVPDILTLDRSLMLGLTLFNVEQELVAVEPEALTVDCGPQFLEIEIEPDRPGPWQVDLGVEDRWLPLAISGQAVMGAMDYDRGTWILTVDRRELGGSMRNAVLRLTVGEGSSRESLDLALADLCPETGPQDLPVVAWTRQPWPNPFNPLVNARFTLSQGASVQAGIFDLSGRRVAVLADGWFDAGDHALQWDGKQAGRSVAAGVYMMRIHTPQNNLMHKVMLLK